MAEIFNFDMFQLSHAGIQQDPISEGVSNRRSDMKISNFGALKVGARSSDDYTKVLNNFKNKDEMMNPGTPALSQGAESDKNPLVWGSTVKYTRDDQMIRMGNSTTLGSYIGIPSSDVSDTKVAIVDTSVGNNSIKNWPTEGWRSYGGKYDFSEEYQG